MFRYKTPVQCLVCEKELETEGEANIWGGGFVQLYFGFGSKLDQLIDSAFGFGTIQGYICDDCTRAKQHLLYRLRTTTTKTEEISDFEIKGLK
jgi:hypothetical protein